MNQLIKIKKTICLHNECLRKKKYTNQSNCSVDLESPSKMSGDETPEEFATNDIIINVLDVNNNSLHLSDISPDEDSKPRVVTRTLLSRSESQSSQLSQPTKRVPYGGMFARFIEAVDEMNKIVLIPSKLQDIDYDENEDIPVVLDTNSASGSDMHSGFKLLNSFRNSIVHSHSHSLTTVSNGNQYETQQNNNDRSVSPKLIKQYSITGEKLNKDFAKEVSLDSGYTSIVADNHSQSYSSTSSVNTEDESDVIADMSDMTLSFYHHLYGLNIVLEKLTDTAKFISYKYEQNLQ